MSEPLSLFSRPAKAHDPAADLDARAALQEGLLIARGELDPFDVAFARAIAGLAGETRASVLLAAALTSRAARGGHAQVPVTTLGRELSDIGDPDETEALLGTLLAASPLVGAESSVGTPLVFDVRGRLYLRRHWEDEEALASALRRMLAAPPEKPKDAAAVRTSVERLFPAPPRPHGSRASRVAEGTVDPQRVGAVLPLVRRLSVITGGPGTGKTTTVVRLLALVLEEAARRGEEPRILLLAPTGKAAARLVESIHTAKGRLGVHPSVGAAIPDKAQTIHRALRPRGLGSFGFVHGKARPLACDLAVVDEASMIDLFLMRSLVDALPEGARLVLLGDRDQLASIDVGTLLGDLVPAEPSRVSLDLARELEPLVGGAPSGDPATPPGTLADAIVVLDRTYRFGGAIAELARAVQAGDAPRAVEVLSSRSADVEVHFTGEEDPPERIVMLAVGIATARYAFLAGDGSAEEKLAKLDSFRVLSAHRRGRLGSTALAAAIDGAVFGARGTEASGGRARPGRPILVTENDPATGLANGDVGLLHDDGDRVLARFPVLGTRALGPSRLPPYESALAMSVHKSQGSQFDEVLLVLPQRMSPVLSRELVYTAITRARSRVIVVTPRAVFEAAIERPIARASGLREKLWGDGR